LAVVGTARLRDTANMDSLVRRFNNVFSFIWGHAGSRGVDTAFDAAYIALWQLARHLTTTLLGVALASK
jgi:hypothetical protein